jgi:uncharacterized protein (PEP-CTERM system associated)
MAMATVMGMGVSNDSRAGRQAWAVLVVAVAAAGTKPKLRLPRIRSACLLLGVGLIASSPAQAQIRPWQIEPRVSISGTFTDNVTLAPDDQKQSEFIVQLVPGIRIDGATARLRLNLDYSMSNLLYARESARNQTQHYLAGRGTLEAIDNWLFVDAHATVTQHAVSVFGAQPLAPELVTGNRARTSTYLLSPYVRGQLLGAADYELRYRWSTTSSAAARQVGTDTSEWIGTLIGPTDRMVGWTLQASHLNVNYDTDLDVEATRVRGTLGYRVDVDLRIHGIAGYERNNYLAVDTTSRVNYGAGFDWTPTDRTHVAGTWERRFFGNGHSLTLRHRTARTAWQLSDRKEETILPNQLAFAGAGTAFDLLFDALAATIPDPVERAREVERLLVQRGIPRDLALRFGFLTTRAYVERTQHASVALLGVNNTVTFAVHQSERQALGPGAATVDDFTLSPEIEQRGVSVSWARHISELTTLNVQASQVRSRAIARGELDSTHSMLNVLLSRQLGARTHGTLGARLMRFNRAGTPDATERALTATLTMTF